MARIFLVLAVLLGCFWWLRQRAQARLREERAARHGPAHGSPVRDQPAPAQQAMVQCARCGVHLPQGEAIAYRGLHYCRRAHLPADSDPDSPAA
ncbi:PP0621 family protein [Cupriavidus sp. CuC1]|uniref:PP0621 family protein n=1 Tax=Cupriavidus sp. CuC1 TaxID=3373131 RepID=UPI0037D76099